MRQTEHRATATRAPLPDSFVWPWMALWCLLVIGPGIAVWGAVMVLSFYIPWQVAQAAGVATSVLLGYVMYRSG